MTEPRSTAARVLAVLLCVAIAVGSLGAALMAGWCAEPECIEGALGIPSLLLALTVAALVGFALAGSLGMWAASFGAAAELFYGAIAGDLLGAAKFALPMAVVAWLAWVAGPRTAPAPAEGVP